MAEAVRGRVAHHDLALGDLAGVVCHGGNGRMAPLLARQLVLPADRVWSTTATTGNLGSVSLPAAWTEYGAHVTGPVGWTAVGAGLAWGAFLSRLP
jgi:3-oxoacyl-[acyl-carrier-protein] synthase III